MSYFEIAFTPAVRAAQAEHGRELRIEADDASERLGEAEAAFIGERDSFYLASVSETGWPYVQHRGGPKGFLKVQDARTLAFADYRGNRQYISAGNTRVNDRVALFLMDYPRRARLKIYAHMESIPLEADPELAARVVEGATGRPERILKLHVAAFSWNCSQHITPRYSGAELAPTLIALRDRIAELETENAELRKREAGASA